MPVVYLLEVERVLFLMPLGFLTLLRYIKAKGVLVQELVPWVGLCMLAEQEWANSAINPDAAPHLLQLIIEFLLGQENLLHFLIFLLDILVVPLNCFLTVLEFVPDLSHFAFEQTLMIHYLVVLCLFMVVLPLNILL